MDRYDALIDGTGRSTLSFGLVSASINVPLLAAWECAIGVGLSLVQPSVEAIWLPSRIRDRWRLVYSQRRAGSCLR